MPGSDRILGIWFDIDLQGPASISCDRSSDYAIWVKILSWSSLSYASFFFEGYSVIMSILNIFADF